jgi:hypothetical protein
VGVDAIPLRILAIPFRLRLGLAADEFVDGLETDPGGG